MTGSCRIVVVLLAFVARDLASAHPCDIGDNFDSWYNNAIQKEVVVVGAGVAGLNAAKILEKNGVPNYVLLEAQDYIGGRVKTRREGSILTEDGAEWINGGQDNPLYGLAEQLGLLTQPKPDSAYNWMARTQSGAEADPSGFDVAKDLMEECEKDAVQQSYYGSGYGKCYADKFSPAYDSSPAKASEKSSWLHYLNTWVLKDTGLVNWEEMSMKDADHFTDWTRDEWNQWKSGFDKLVEYIKKDVPDAKVKLSSPVCRIYWDQIPGNQVLVVTKDGTSYKVDHVIMTASIGHLKERHTDLFIPALPAAYQTAMAATKLGLCNKVQIGWDSAWWGTKLLNLQVIFTEDLPKEMSWLYGIMEYLTIHQQDTMVQGFVTGNEAYDVEDIPETTLKQHLVWFLANATGMTVPEPTFFRRSQWQKNVWMRGSYNSYVTLAGNLANRDPLAQATVKAGKPLLLWAGEHTHTTRYGTVDGAMDTGEREAWKVIDYLDTLG